MTKVRQVLLCKVCVVLIVALPLVAGPFPPPGFYKYGGGGGVEWISLGSAYVDNETSNDAVALLSPVWIGNKVKQRPIQAWASRDNDSNASAVMVSYFDGTKLRGVYNATLPDTIFSSLINDAKDVRIRARNDHVVVSWLQQEGSFWVVYAMQATLYGWRDLAGTGTYPTRVTVGWTQTVSSFDMELNPETGDPGFVWVFQYIGGPREVHFAYWANGQINTLATGATSKLYDASGEYYQLLGVALAYDPMPDAGMHDPHILIAGETAPGSPRLVRHPYYKNGTGWLWGSDIPASCTGWINADFSSGFLMATGQSVDAQAGQYVWFGSMAAGGTWSAAALDSLDAVFPSLATTQNGKVELVYFDTTDPDPDKANEIRCAEKQPGKAWGRVGYPGTAFSVVTNNNLTETYPAVTLNKVNKPVVVWTKYLNGGGSIVEGAMHQY
ncbi:MAG: hypothetical protein U0517_03520 [Candidatus Andersenbacteria bacterium]